LPVEGKKIYGRHRLFEKIKRGTTFGVHGEKPVRSTMQAWKELKRDGYPRWRQHQTDGTDARQALRQVLGGKSAGGGFPAQKKLKTTLSVE